jgi:hypothetical protein
MGSSSDRNVGGRSLAGRTADGGAGQRWDRIAAIAGLVFIVLIVASFFTPETPASDTPAEEMAATIVADQAGHELSIFLAFLGDIAFLVFLAGVWSRLRRWEGVGGMLAGLFALAGVVFYATILVSEGLYLALVKGASGSDPAVLPTIAVLDDWVGATTVPAGVATFLGAAGAILTTRALPAWLGWLAAVTALALLLSIGGVFQDDVEGFLDIAGFAGFLLFLVWVLATSIVLLLRAGGEPDGEPGHMRDAGRLAA